MQIGGREDHHGGEQRLAPACLPALYSAVGERRALPSAAQQSCKGEAPDQDPPEPTNRGRTSQPAANDCSDESCATSGRFAAVSRTQQVRVSLSDSTCSARIVRRDHSGRIERAERILSVSGRQSRPDGLRDLEEIEADVPENSARPTHKVGDISAYPRGQGGEKG